MAIVGRHQRAAAGGAAVGDVGEGQAGEAQLVYQGVGAAGAGAAAVGKLHILPLHAGILERHARGEGALLQAAALRGTAEGVNPDSNNCDIHGSGSCRCEGEIDDLGAILFRAKGIEHHVHIHADGQLFRIILRQPPLDTNGARQLHVADAVGLEGLLGFAASIR